MEAKFASRAAAHSTAAAPAPAPTPAERNAMSGTAPASSSGRAADAISPKQTNPNAMADMLRQMHQMGLSMDRRGSPSAALDAGTSGLSQLIEKPQSSPLAEARNLNVDGTTGGAGPPPARSEPQAGKDDKGDQMRAQMHAYGAMFLDPLSALTTSAGLGAPSVPPVQSPDTREETTKSEPWNGMVPLSAALYHSCAHYDIRMRLCWLAAFLLLCDRSGNAVTFPLGCFSILKPCNLLFMAVSCSALRPCNTAAPKTSLA